MGLCQFVMPAIIARAMHWKDQYTVPAAETHPDWSCDLWEDGE